MATKKFKVTAERLSLGGKTYAKGETFEGDTKSAHVATALHFRQIVEAKEPKKAEEPPKGPNGGDPPAP